MTALSVTAIAPVPPGRLGQAIPEQEILRYLDALGSWRDQRRNELDRLDEAALAAPDRDAYTGDVILSMALWKAVADRHDQLVKTWDSGRVGRSERERMSQLIWGRLDAQLGAGLAVSLVEACRLSDALAGQLRTRLSLDPVGADVAARVRQLRAQMERVRDLTVEEPAGVAREDAARILRRLDERLVDVVARAGRGADVSGPISTLEADAARAERDFIVGAATRRDAVRDAARARTLRAELDVREVALHDLVAQCVAEVRPVPRFAVPDVSNLGPVPAPGVDGVAAVAAYLARLAAVARAFTMVEAAYNAPLTERDDLRGRLQAYRAKAAAIGLAGDQRVAQAYRHAREALWSTPTDLVEARDRVDSYQALIATPGRTA